ncbi:MAG: hypothetical protein ACREFX_10880 [Opitutaceae bacterium]
MLLSVGACASLSFAQPDAAAAQPPYPVPPEWVGSVALPPALSPGGAQRAIFAALANRQWTVVSVTPGVIVAHLLHRHIDATLTIRYSSSRVDIYAESYLVGHHPQDRILPYVRRDWIHNLEHDIARYAGGRD